MNNPIVRPPMPPFRYSVEDTFWDMVLRPGRKEKELNAAAQKKYELEMAEFRGYMNVLAASGKP